MKRLKRILRILQLVILTPIVLVFTLAVIQVICDGGTTAPQVTDRPIYTFVPTQTDSATDLPDSTPTAVPAKPAAKAPTTAPTKTAAQVPTAAPTAVPTAVPTQAPTAAPTKVPEPGITAPYVGNANSKVFHSAGCSSVTDMKKSNRVPLSSRESAIEKGYKPCQRCDP